MGDTSIEWTHFPGYRGRTWNPTRGCSRVSQGCENCYAEVIAGRFSGPGQAFEGFATRNAKGRGRWTRKIALLPSDRLDDPLAWRDPSAIFVNSTSDLFHEHLDFEEIAAVFGVMAACPEHLFMVLTKRSERMAKWFRWVADSAFTPPVGICLHYAQRYCEHRGLRRDTYPILQRPWPLPNVILGVSVESQAHVGRVAHLVETPAALRMVSAEPLLGVLDIDRWLGASVPEEPEAGIIGGVDWVVAGGESGPGARPMHPEWARALRFQCQVAGVPFFLKQIGAFAPTAVDMQTGQAVYRTFFEKKQWIDKGATWLGRGDECLGANGRLMRRGADFDDPAAYPVVAVRRVRKKAAGRTLDGREHLEFPEVRHG